MVRSTDQEQGRSAGFVALVLAVLAVAGCTSGDRADHRRSAADELRQAVQATLASTSFVVRTQMESGPEDVEVTEVYQAPDRLRMTIGDVEKITIGLNRYSGPGAIDDSYVRTTAEPSDQRDTFALLLTDLRPLATAREVTRDGSTYHYRLGSDGKALSSTATIKDGRIESVTLGRGFGHGWATRTEISDYDRAPAINTPPADRTLDEDEVRQGTIDPAIADLLTR